MKRLFRIKALDFCCGIETEDDKVIRTAPKLKYMRGWTLRDVHMKVQDNYWEMMELEWE